MKSEEIRRKEENKMQEFSSFPKSYDQDLKIVLTNIVDDILKERGYLPLDSDLTGHTIGLDTFTKKYCYPHSENWVKTNILYRFKPNWCVDVHPGRGRRFTIFEDDAAKWMKENRDKIDWKAGAF